MPSFISIINLFTFCWVGNLTLLASTWDDQKRRQIRRGIFRRQNPRIRGLPFRKRALLRGIVARRSKARLRNVHVSQRRHEMRRMGRRLSQASSSLTIRPCSQSSPGNSPSNCLDYIYAKFVSFRMNIY